MTGDLYQDGFALVENSVNGMLLCLPRIAAVFVILPLLTQENVPALVRNSFLVSLAFMVYPFAFSSLDPTMIAKIDWPIILLKEMMIGACIGFLFGSIFWALSVAGGIIDTQTGSNMANSMDPIQGHQSSPTGSWLSRFATWLFMASGGFMILLDVLFSSYKVWPVTSTDIALNISGATVVINELEFIMSKALIIALPAMLVLSLVDLSLGLINRFAQQINVLALSMPIKSALATTMLVLGLGIIVEVVLTKLFDNRALLSTMKPLFQ